MPIRIVLLRPILVLAAVVLAAWPASAQPRDRKWDVQLFAGPVRSPDPGPGTAALPEAGGALPVFIIGRPSRAVSSWLFGDGTVLANQVNAYEQISSTSIVPLDSVLARSGLRNRVVPTAGARVSRSVTPRYGVEAAVAFRGNTFMIADGLRTGIEASRASFAAFWRDYSTVGGNPFVSAVTRFELPETRQVVGTVGVRVTVASTGKTFLYAVAGGGVRSTSGQPASVTIDARYGLQIFETVRTTEVDVVTLRLDVERHVPVGVLGLGWQYRLSDRIGLHVDARVHLGRSGVSTRLEAQPRRGFNAGSSGVLLILGQDPSIYVSTEQDIPSSLSVPLSGFVAYQSTGLRPEGGLTAGFLLRF